MTPDNNLQPEKMPAAPTGNASNPSASEAPAEGTQLLDKKAEQYLRESAAIEDLPDDNDQQQADNVLRQEEQG